MPISTVIACDGCGANLNGDLYYVLELSLQELYPRKGPRLVKSRTVYMCERCKDKHIENNQTLWMEADIR